MRARQSDSRKSGKGRSKRLLTLLQVTHDRPKKDDLDSALPGTQRLHARSLLEALGRLESGTIDIVVLGAEFGEEEKTLFVLDAHRRGFEGPIFHVVSSGLPTLKSKPVSNAQAKEQISIVPSFTAKEQAVLHRVAGGWTNLQIAKDMQCSVGAVKAILQQLFGKLGVRKRAQIVWLAFERGLPTAPLPRVGSAKE